MGSILTFTKGKVIVNCTEPGCGYHTEKLPDSEAAYGELSHHNYRRHPGVYPRWNPDAKAQETRRGVRKNGREEDSERVPGD